MNSNVALVTISKQLGRIATAMERNTPQAQMAFILSNLPKLAKVARKLVEAETQRTRRSPK